LQHSPPLLCGGSNASLEFDYPQHSRKNLSPLEMLEIDYPEPVVDRFAQTLPPQLLEKNVAEHQACSTNSIRLPPGLEDMFNPEETAARIAVASAAYRAQVEMAKHSANAWSANRDLMPSFDVPFAYDVHGELGNLPPPPQYEPRVPDTSVQLRGLSFQQQPLVSTQPPPLFPPTHAAPPIFSTQAHRDLVSSPTFFQQGNMQQAEILSFPPPEVALQRPLVENLQCRDEGHGVINGTHGWPSIGSQDHYFGNCKPCAFFHRKGCGSGVMCRFCHICDSGEKKKRMREKRDSLRNGCMNL
jgi:hypothetical protein